MDNKMDLFEYNFFKPCPIVVQHKFVCCFIKNPSCILKNCNCNCLYYSFIHTLVP